VWEKKKVDFRSGPYPYIMDMQNLKECYTACIEEFRIMKKNAQDYNKRLSTSLLHQKHTANGSVGTVAFRTRNSVTADLEIYVTFMSSTSDPHLGITFAARTLLLDIE